MTVYLFFELSSEEEFKFVKAFWTQEKAYEYQKENPSLIMITGESN